MYIVMEVARSNPASVPSLFLFCFLVGVFYFILFIYSTKKVKEIVFDGL